MSARVYSKLNVTRPRRPKPPVETEEFQLGEWLGDLWDARYIILACTALAMVAGGIIVWRTPPVYQAEGLLQLHEKKALATDPAFTKIGGLFSEPSDAQVEIEILKSDLVLGRAVKALGMDISAQPKLLPVIGAALARSRNDIPRMEIDTLQVPDNLVGKTFHVTALPGGLVRWSSPTLATLATGKPMDMLYGLVAGEVCKLKVRSLSANPGQEFLVSRTSPATAIDSLRRRFDATERGKETNVIGLSFKGPSPVRSAEVLNTIVTQYVQYKFEKKAGEANQTRAMLLAKLGPLKTELDASESRLNQYRSQYGSVDLPKEAENLLLRSTSLSAEITALEQKKQDALRTFTPKSDVVTTLNEQIQRLRDEAGQVGGKVHALPGTQQEVVRLSRTVELNTELYTSLLNDIQQLQITSSGDVGNLAVVDPATVDPEPVGPKPVLMMSFYTCLGAAVGIGLAMVLQLLRRGIQDHRIIESKLGLPVLVTIPHSRDQEKHSRSLNRSKKGSHLLAIQNPDDLAIESLRSLRTTLMFTLKDAKSHTVMITGPSPGIGKSFICVNLAIMVAQTGARVLLVDADLRRGNQHRYFGRTDRQGGLAEVLAGRAEWKTVATPTEFAGLDLMSTGLIPADSSQLLLSPRFSSFVTGASAAYDYVLFDAPPLLPVTDATIIGSNVGTVLLVAKFGQHTLDEIRTCQQRLEDHGIYLDGCIFNDILPTGLGYGDQDYRYAYHYKYK